MDIKANVKLLLYTGQPPPMCLQGRILQNEGAVEVCE